MDQLVIALGVEGTALLLDCRWLEATAAPLPPDTTVVVCHTGTHRTLLTSAYNARRAEVDEAAKQLGVPALRDAVLDDLARLDDPVLLRRARHVVSENARVQATAEAMRRGDARTTGAAMLASHASLRDDFEASSPALDAMVDLAAALDGCHGARMTGAGWGGCAVALVAAGAAEDFAGTLADRYRGQTGHEPRLYPCLPAAGAGLVVGSVRNTGQGPQA